MNEPWIHHNLFWFGHGSVQLLFAGWHHSRLATLWKIWKELKTSRLCSLAFARIFFPIAAIWGTSWNRIQFSAWAHQGELLWISVDCFSGEVTFAQVGFMFQTLLWGWESNFMRLLNIFQRDRHTTHHCKFLTGRISPCLYLQLTRLNDQLDKFSVQQGISSTGLKNVFKTLVTIPSGKWNHCFLVFTTIRNEDTVHLCDRLLDCVWWLALCLFWVSFAQMDWNWT